jgi:hypothetical protein
MHVKLNLKILFICAPFLIVGLGWVGYKLYIDNIYPFYKNGMNYQDYRKLGDISNWQRLLVAERWFGGGFPKGVVTSKMESTSKVWHGDIVYIYNNHDVYKEKSKRPIAYVSFNQVTVKDRIGFVVSEKVLNKNGTVSFLHFGITDQELADPIIIGQFSVRMTMENGYLVPVAFVANCNKENPSTEICKQTDWNKTKKLVEEWVSTGIVPGELEKMLLVPYLASW